MPFFRLFTPSVRTVGFGVLGRPSVRCGIFGLSGLESRLGGDNE